MAIIWVFDHEPTLEEMVESLSTIPAWSGSDKTMAEYVDYVIPLKGSKKVDGNWVTEWRLYMGVHGRVVINRDAHGDQPLSEHFEMEWRPPWLIVKGSMTSPIFGTAFDVATAWIGEDPKNADKTNPLENAVTSWRGRVIAALCGAGIIPSSGIASAEEMTQAKVREEYKNKGMMATVDASSPETQRQVKQQDTGGSDAVIKGIVDGIKAKAGAGFESAAMQWLQSTEREVGDSQTAEDVLLTLSTTELGEAFREIVRNASSAEGT